MTSMTNDIPKKPFRFADYRIDLEASRDGAWFAMQPFFEKRTVRLAADGEPRVRICYWDSKPFQSVLAEGLAAAGEDGEKRVDAINAAIAKRLVTDWADVPDDEGNALPFSKEACLAKLTDEELPEFSQFVSACARQLDTFRRKQGRSLGN